MDKESAKFIKKGLLFFIVVILCVTIVNQVFIKTVIEKETISRAYEDYKDYIGNDKDKHIGYAFFGDSHCSYAVNPYYMNDSYNLCDAGEGYVETYFKLKNMVEKDNIIIDNIVVEVDLHTFSDKMRQGKEFPRNNMYIYRNYADLKSMSELRKENIIQSFIWSEYPFIGRGNDLILVNTAPPEMTELYYGWTKNDEDFSTKNMTELAAWRYSIHFNQNPTEEQLFENTSVEYFLKMLEYAKEKRINIIFISYPLSEQYDNVVGQNNINRDNYYARLFTLIDTAIGEDYEYYDYYTYYFSRPDYFFNSDHLNQKGSTDFTIELESTMTGK